MTHKTETEKLVDLCRRACERRDTMQMLTTADEILRRDPANVDAMFVAGTAMLHGSQEGLAVLVLNAARCATKDPVKLGAIWNNIGFGLQNYQPEEAYRAFKEALKFGDAPSGMYDNLCNVASQIGRHAEALDWADKAGKSWDTSHNRAFALLHLGRWDEAWPLYAKTAGNEEVRPRTSRSYDLPRWAGQKVGGKGNPKLIIHGEQGVGDEIMFMSMVPKDFDGVIESSPRIAELFKRSFPKASVYGTLLQGYIEWPLEERADYHIEMGGLGEYFAAQPYARGSFLAADAARVAGWKAWLECSGRNQSSLEATASFHRSAIQGRNAPRVGISWTGGTWATGRAKRSIVFDLISDLVELNPQVTFVCLEYEDRKDELSTFPQVLNPHWATKKGADIDDLAALVSNLDLVISATNSTVDLCGGLGVPTWALVDAEPQWRYSPAAAPAGADTMWFYDSVRTFRQKPGQSWAPVIATVGKELKAHCAIKPALELVQ